MATISCKEAAEILNVWMLASEKEITKKFKHLAKIYHPDKTKGNKKKERMFKKILEAYEVLVDKKYRDEDYIKLAEEAFLNDT